MLKGDSYMRTCHVCGREVDDRTYICPDCGAEVVGSSGGLTLKANAPEKKKATNTLGTTISTGSGLTDILKADDEENSEFYGSMPNPVSYDLTDYESEKKAKNHYGALIFKIVVVGMIAFVMYLLITKIFLKKDGAESYKEALDTYMEAINEADQDKMEYVSPAFLTDRESASKQALAKLDGVKIEKYEIEETYFLTAAEREKLQESIKAATTRTPKFSDVVNIKLRIYGELKDLVPTGARNGNIIVQAVCIRDSWYILLEEYEVIKFN